MAGAADGGGRLVLPLSSRRLPDVDAAAVAAERPARSERRPARSAGC